MNYESDAMSADEMVEATYDAGSALNRLKGRIGIIEPEVAARTEERIVAARAAMARVDAIRAMPEASAREKELAALKHDLDRLSESTVCEKSELNWPRYVSIRNVYYVLLLWLTENLATLFRSRRIPSATRSACETTSEA